MLSRTLMASNSARWRAPCVRRLLGRAVTPSVFDMMLVLGREESLLRIEQAGRLDA